MLWLHRKIQWITSLRSCLTTNEMIISALGSRERHCRDRIRMGLPFQCSFQVHREKKINSVCKCLHLGFIFLTLSAFKDKNMDLPDNFDFASVKSTWLGSCPFSSLADSSTDGSGNTELNVGTNLSTWGSSKVCHCTGIRDGKILWADFEEIFKYLYKEIS